MEQAHVSIDPMRPADQQIEDTVKALKPIIPLSMEQATLAVHIPAQYAARAYGAIKEFGLQDQNWLSDGSFAAKVTIPAGMKDNVYRVLGSVTEGNAKIEEK